MHKKSRKHSGVVLVYSLLKKKKKKTGAACPSISSLFPLFGEVEGRRRRGVGGGVENRSQVLRLVPRA